jgi:N-methylhydantoinase B
MPTPPAYPEQLDVLTLMVIKGALEQVADEADATLQRTAMSPAISQGNDCSHGIYHPRTGETLVQGRLGLTIFVGCMQAAVQHVIETYPEGLAPGDVVLLNDPYVSGTHMQDLVMITPLYVDGKLFCYFASDAHMVDIGGPVAGGFNASADSYYQEGVIVGPVHLYRGGDLQQDVLNLLTWNCRMPERYTADVMAMRQALRVGVQRLEDVLRTHGTATVSAAMEELMERAEQVIRSHIAELPDGTYAWSDFLDNDGHDVDNALEVAVEVVVDGDELTLDFTASSPAGKGPFNIARPTLEAACYVALKHLFPDVVSNAGCMRPIQVVVPDGTVVSALRPRPVGGYLDVTVRAMEAVFGAVAQADAEISYAGSYGSANALAIAGVDDDGADFMFFTWFGGGLGGNAHGDGLTHGPGPVSAAPLQPVETLEATSAVTFTEYSIRPDSAGRGTHRGGYGSIYRMRLDAEEAVLSITGDRGRFAPFGIAGGESAVYNEIEFHRADGSVERPAMTSKATGLRLHRGDEVVIRTSGGGGWGPPEARDPALDVRDRELGYLTEGSA